MRGTRDTFICVNYKIVQFLVFLLFVIPGFTQKIDWGSDDGMFSLNIKRESRIAVETLLLARKD